MRFFGISLIALCFNTIAFSSSEKGPQCENPKNCMLESLPPKAAPKKPISEVTQNIYGKNLSICSLSPKTGWFRDGTCKSDPSDRGNHSVCAVLTDKFLKYSKSQGNDLITPNPRYNFPGLKEGDKWCLCAARYKEAQEVGIELKMIKEATHKRALEVLPTLKE